MTLTQDIINTFDTKIEGTTKRRDGTQYDWAYNVIRYAQDINIALYRTTVKDHDGSMIDLDNVESISELHLVDDAGSWCGGSISIYAPELDYKWRVGGNDEFVVKPAHVSASSSTLDTTDHARAQALMVNIAANYADIFTEERTPALEIEAAERTVERDARDAEREAEREAQKLRMDSLADPGDTVRVTVTNQKTALVGVLRNVDRQGLRFSVKVSYKEEPIIVHLSQVTKFETKLAHAGRFLVLNV